MEGTQPLHLCLYYVYIYIHRKRVTDVIVTSFAKCM